MKYIKYLFVFTLLFLVSFGVKAVDIPEADITYTNDWENTLTIDTNKTIKLVNITHANVDSGDAAIKITNNSTVNIVFEGNNTLMARSNVIGAGIQVDEGSTLNLFGLNNSTLTVYGGQYSAGIGGKGYSGISAANAKAGNINIYSGKIIAHGGLKGAGIGSGYHSSASDIHIYGGDIEAYGNGDGAGIGSGYGTSGGSGDEAGTGYYNGGNITIEGGTVKAATYDYDFTKFNQYDLNTLYDENYQDTMAAGIGGGYGASSGVIVIGGNADVIAIGSCGGAGIGSGRGTPKQQNYNEDNYFVDVTITGYANVVALTTDDRRTTVDGDNGGAAIGHGRGATLEGTSNGSVKIMDHASVYAVGSYHSQAIGGSSIVQKFIKDENNNIVEPPTAKLETLEIGEYTTVVAISDGYVNAIDNDKAERFISLNFDKEFLEGENFVAETFPFNIKARHDNQIIKFSLQDRNKHNVMFKIRNSNNYYLYFDGRMNYYLAHDGEKNMALFESDNNEVKEYNVTRVTEKLLVVKEIDTEFGKINVRINAPIGLFEVNSVFYAKTITDENVIKKLANNIDPDNKINLSKMLFIDFGVLDPNGDKYKNLSDEVMIYIEMPQNWKFKNIKLLYVTDGEDEDYSTDARTYVYSGKTYYGVKIKHFSNYGLFLYDNVELNVSNPNTSDNIITYIVLTIISTVSLIIIYIRRKQLIK